VQQQQLEVLPVAGMQRNGHGVRVKAEPIDREGGSGSSRGRSEFTPDEGIRLWARAAPAEEPAGARLAVAADHAHIQVRVGPSQLSARVPTVTYAAPDSAGDKLLRRLVVAAAQPTHEFQHSAAAYAAAAYT
jgi:hypothetical protein